jgi:biopolymer transport protein ExbB
VTHDFWNIAQAGGTVGYLILILSIAALALAIEQAITLRASVLMPDGLATRVREQLAAGQVVSALQQCKLQPSVLSHVLQAGLNEADAGWPIAEKAMEDAAAEQSARLMRKVEYLSVIANLAPMLGLLGTVIGMVVAFREVAQSQGAARAADLAEGIYLALVTTVEGLVVAIPTLGVFAWFRSRLEQLFAEVTAQAQQATAPLRRPSNRGAPPLPPPRSSLV